MTVFSHNLNIHIIDIRQRILTMFDRWYVEILKYWLWCYFPSRCPSCHPTNTVEALLIYYYYGCIEYAGAVLEENIWGQCPQTEVPSGKRRRRENRGGAVVSPIQPTTVQRLGASESGAEPRSETHFGVFWMPQNALLCTYMLGNGARWEVR